MGGSPSRRSIAGWRRGLATLAAALAIGTPAASCQEPPAAVKAGDPARRSTASEILALCGNPPVGHPTATFPEDPGPAKSAFDADKLWKEKRRLVVRFLDASDDPWSSYLLAKVAEIAPTWTHYADVPMQFVRSDAPPSDITLNFHPYRDPNNKLHDYRSYNSVIGSPSANVARGRASLNLVFPPELNKPNSDGESEFNRLILHEFGHALGLIHEHQHPTGRSSGTRTDSAIMLANAGVGRRRPSPTSSSPRSSRLIREGAG